ncbi:MAG: solute:sodium symporter family transporter [Lachnospiraceae bacterium]|nr:solute:sodium symporter family transporter [Lachnospiraceae bacterium]
MNFLNSTPWVILTFLAFTVLVAVIASWKTKGDNLETADGYFLASRSLPGYVIAGSLLLTNLSAEQLVGLNGQSWQTNMSPSAFEVGSIFTLLFLAHYFLPRYLKMGTTTIPAMMEERFGKGVKLMFSAIIVLMYSFLNLPVILYSGAVAFVRIFNFDKFFGGDMFKAVAVLCVVIGIAGACYAIFGGLKAVAVSDTINGIGLLIAGFLIPFIALFVLGRETSGGGIIAGWNYIVTTEPAKLNAWSAWNSAQPNLPWPLIFTGMLFSNLYWWCTNQSFVQRSLAAKSLIEGQKGAIYCGFLKCLGPLYLIFPGIIAYHMPSIADTINNSASPIDMAYPALIAHVVPTPVMGFFAAVLFGAILSSFNSVLNSACTMFTLDIFKGSKAGQKKTDAQLVKISKTYGTIAAVISIAIAPFVMYANGITTFLNSLANFLSLPVLCTVLGVMWFRKAPKFTPYLITIVHFVVYGAFLIMKPCYPGTTEEIHYLYAMAVLFPLYLIIMAVLSKVSPSEEYIVPNVDAVDLTPWKLRWPITILGLFVAVIFYIVFSPLGIAA